MKVADLVEWIRLLSAGLNYAAIYDGGHMRVLDAARGFHRVFGARLEDIQEDGIFLGVVNRRVVWDGHPVIGATVIARRLIQAAERLGVGGFLFHRGLDEEEVVRFLRLCGGRETARDVSETRRLLVAHGVSHVSPSPRHGEPGWLGDRWDAIHGGKAKVSGPAAQPETPGTATNSLACYAALVSSVEEAQSAAYHDRGVETDGTRGIADGLVGLMGRDAGSLMHLSRYPDYESYTVGHSVRVALFCVLVGHRAGMRHEDLVDLATSALLHDAGKGRIPHEILYKTTALDAEEREVMASHTVLGAEVLLRSHGAGPHSVSAALCHHLREDRTGYPDAPSWVRCSWTTRLIQVCDVFEALTAIRPYKPAMSPRRAYEIILKERSAFEPTCVAALFRATGLYPPGCRVRLGSGRQAIVHRVTADPVRPVVEVLPTSEAVPAETPELVDLSSDLAPDAERVEDVLAEDPNRTPCAETSDRSVSARTYDCGHEVS